MKKKLTLLVVLSICICLVAAPIMGVIAAASNIEEETSSGETAELPPSTTTTVATTTTTTVASSTTTSTTTTTQTTTTKPKTKYPEAQIVWDALIDYGLSPEVASGIMGNIMAEVGGQTLDFSIRYMRTFW